ncbi:MAG: transcriptional regulator [Acidimicrobiales bacterium]
MSAEATDIEPINRRYAVHVGARLRAIRKQKGLSLQEVEAVSDQEFKASVLGAYERGERAISVPRLQRLARQYSVPVDQLLPRDGVSDRASAVIDLDNPEGSRRPEPVVIDLQRVELLEEPARGLLRRYLEMIQVQRGDFNGRVFTVRRDDVRAIAVLLDTDPDGARSRLTELGLRVSA